MKNNHAMMVRADALAIGMVSALSTTNRRKPRTHSRVADFEGRTGNECVSIMPDGTRKSFSVPRAHNTNVAGITRRTSKQDTAATYFARLAQLGAVDTD